MSAAKPEEPGALGGAASFSSTPFAMPSQWRVDEICSEPGLASLADEWNALSEQSDTALLFNSHDWVSACWQHFHRQGRGRSTPALWVLALRDGSCLLAIAPLWVETRRVLGLPLRIARWIGEGPSDYGDLLLARSEPALVDAIASHLFGRHRRCDVLDLRECRGDSPTLPWLRAALVRTSSVLRESPDSLCLSIPTDGGWETYAARQFSGKRRKGFRREGRNLEAAGGFEWVTLKEVASPSQLADAFGEVQAAHVAASESRPGEYNDPVYRPFMETVIAAASSRGWLRAFVLTRHGQVVAFTVTFAYRGRCYLYNTAHTAESQEHGAGKLLILYTLEGLFGEGMTVIDFLRGAESYKEMLTDRSTTNVRLSCAGRVAGWLWFDLLPRVHGSKIQRLGDWIGEHGLHALGRRILGRLIGRRSA